MSTMEPVRGGASSSTGSSPGTRSIAVKTQTLRATVSGSLPRRRAIRVTRSFCSLEPGRIVPAPRPPDVPRIDPRQGRLQDPLRPCCPIMRGYDEPSEAAGPRRSVPYAIPFERHPLPASNLRTIWNASMDRAALPSNGRPNASNSARFHPAPRPRVSRPPLISSTVAAILARTGGWRNARAGNERVRVSIRWSRSRSRRERERFQRSSFRALVAVEQVIANPDRVEPRLFRRPGHGEVLADRDLPLGFRKLDPYPWPSRHPPEHTAGTSRRPVRRR